ncbi:hypothetical protein [Gracilibacillus sp. YIM 98692]|uniref:hypothetical protein n=1 Tax=Gracilibacillus sp. YIM 98692 TaxID=2663532 RepID=UPI0013CF422F|nr:hypothetical protein [Gracilibacillus sp. YIM 98692]
MLLRKYIIITGIIAFWLSLLFPLQVLAKESIFEKAGNIGQVKASKQGLTIPVNKKLTIKDHTILITESFMMAQIYILLI